VASSGFIANGAGINPDGTSGILNGADGANTVLGMRTDGAFSPFEGTFDDTAIYNYALSAQQVKGHYFKPIVFDLDQSRLSDCADVGSGNASVVKQCEWPLRECHRGDFALYLYAERVASVLSFANASVRGVRAGGCLLGRGAVRPV